jgi:UPF0288 family protein (methanogenesis marker protein 3)
MGNRKAKSLTFHELLHFKFTDVRFVQFFGSKAYTPRVLPPNGLKHNLQACSLNLNIIQDHT